MARAIAVIGQHASHVEVLDDDPVVGLDQLARYLVQEMAAHIGDTMVSCVTTTWLTGAAA
ncbi:hypothetical protein AWC01_00780 [Mycobacterium doricum]|uniref:Uncharacterized protein n=1 Tax=Mycolicibacterium doricum TaxID=126673 RepID=A0A1X1SWF4_9MYCO|nr:hypothetical protein [Mycolicibacterium doricum]ORV35263.1 hypothetical protein AWC01_00780 [Mycolicibacterium doricum]